MSSSRRILLSSFLVLVLLYIPETVKAATPLLDAAGQGTLQLQSVPQTISTSSGIVTIIDGPSSDILSVDTDGDDSIQILCKGAALEQTSELERSSLAFCSLLSNVIIVNGISAGELDGPSFRDSRHSRTLTTLFRAKLIDNIQSEAETKTITTLIFVYDTVDDDLEATLRQEVLALYQAAAAERPASPTFSSLYDVKVTTNFDKAVEMASKIKSETGATTMSLPVTDAFRSAWTTVRETDVAAALSAGIDPPHVANAFVTVMNAHAKYTKSARAKIMAWKGRIARGLTIDSFGTEASGLRKRCLVNGYDVETLSGAGLPQVAQYRLELRTQLQSLIDTAIEDCFDKQVINIEASSVKRLQKKLLKTLLVDGSTYESNEAAINANAALLRQQAFASEVLLESLQVPELSLTKEKASRQVGAALNDALLAFPDSPAAKLKRTRQVEKVVKKESKNKKKKPGQRSFGLGVDLVAMLRPDGFGSLQGFAGYALPGGNSITFGVHNDADDPQVIAQFGGVRPPLLRVQPKLRIDVEL